MSKEDIKQIFFELLTEDEEFQKKLTEFILAAVAKKSGEHIAQEEPPIVKQENVADDLQAELDKLRDAKKSAEDKRDALQIELDNLRDAKKSVEDERNALQIELDKIRDAKKSAEDERDALQIELDKIRDAKKSAEDERDGLKFELDKLRRDKKSVEDERNGLKFELDKIRRDKKSVEDERNGLKFELDKIRRDKEYIETEREELKTQLAERFAEGWEIYKTFLKLDAMSRKDSGLYTESFEAFICSGAQLKRLEGIWESALNCKRERKIDDAEIFWDVFAYCVNLVNTALGDKIIEILDTQIGDRYDTDKHSTSGTNSSTQGSVREIILAGYRNNTSRKIVKKSNVRVG